MQKKRILAAAFAAVLGINGISATVPTVSAANYAAKKARVSVHDPSIFKDPVSKTYYVFGSHIDAAKSTDLQSWQLFSNGYATSNNKLFGALSSNLQKPFAWAGENLEDCAGGFAVWAPDVIWNPDYVNADGSKGAYMMYFCTSSTYKRSVIAFGVSKTAEGPYSCVDTLIYSGFTSGDSYATSSTKNVNRKYTSTNIDELIAAGQVTYNDAWFNKGDFNNQQYPNAIDPTIYYDTDGRMYMTYGSWSGGIFTLEIDKATGKCIHPKTSKTADGRMVDSYFGTKISGGFGKSGEGPFIEYNEDTGFYYLWVTYGGLTATGGYNMRVFRSKSPTGPFTDAAGNNAVLAASGGIDGLGVKVMTNYQFSSLPTAYMACGHNSVLKDDDGQWYLFNHTRFNQGTEYHEVRVHPMKFNEAGWPVVLPYEYSGDTWSEAGYEPSSLVGTYEFINHGTATNGTVTKAANISLNADGSISGAATGKWSEKEGSAAADFSIGNVNYHGYFQAQHDESGTGKVVMTFSAVGMNNQTIWGAQTTQWNGKERTLLADYSSPDSQICYHTDGIVHENGNVMLGDTSILSGVSYYIRNVNSGLVVDLPEGKTADGTVIQQWTKTGGKQQEWRLTDLGNGYCKICSLADESKCIAVETETAEDGAAITLQTYAGTPNQQWKLMKNGGVYAIVSRCSGDTAGMDVYEWSKDNGGVIKQWNAWGGECQLWTFEAVHPAVTAGTYAIRACNSGYYVGSGADGLLQSADRQLWNLEDAGDGFFTICDQNGMTVTVADSADGAALTLAENDGSSNQKFALQCNQDGSYSLLSMISEKKSGFDVYEVSKENGAKICQWNFHGGSGQKFILEPEKPMTIQPIETTTTTTTTTTVVQEKGMLGDVNCDGSVNITDVIMLSRYCADDAVEISTQGIVNADTDANTQLSVDDVTLILQHIARLINLNP